MIRVSSIPSWSFAIPRWLLLASALVLTACGGGGSSGTSVATAPTLTISSDVVSGPASGPFKVTFDFSDEVSIPSNGGILPFATLRGNMIAGSFTKVNPSKYTAEILPHDNQTLDFSLTVPPGAFRNAAGNASNLVGYTFSQALYTVGPESVWTDNSSDLFITGPVIVTLTFDSVLTTPLLASQLVVTGAGNNSSISNFVKLAGSTDIYQFTYTPPAAISFGSVVITLPKDSVSAGATGNYQSYWSRGINTP